MASSIRGGRDPEHARQRDTEIGAIGMRTRRRELCMSLTKRASAGAWLCPDWIGRDVLDQTGSTRCNHLASPLCSSTKAFTVKGRSLIYTWLEAQISDSTHRPHPPFDNLLHDEAGRCLCCESSACICSLGNADNRYSRHILPVTSSWSICSRSHRRCNREGDSC